MPYACAALIRRDTAEILRPPRRMAVSEAARRHVRVVASGGAPIP